MWSGADVLGTQVEVRKMMDLKFQLVNTKAGNPGTSLKSKSRLDDWQERVTYGKTVTVS